ncbi:LCP family protein [Brevibacillus daliensis]|uniref:LCP family protein n=1 Tax=Brevibacillus daliensis TaxID=2892995 RepID=UPI001E395D7F|nr:LCP family protein [Brevibacillus daliensis]
MNETVATNRKQRTAPKGKKTKKKNKKLRIILLTFFALLLMGGGTYAYYVVQSINGALEKATKNPYQDVKGPAVADEGYSSDKPISVVLLGRDSRVETGSLNTDVMIVGVIDPATKKITTMSIPRDTRVKIPGYKGYNKINAVFANGEIERRQAQKKGETPTENGVTLTKKTLEEVLGIPINHYVELDFNGFKAIVDAIGGVEVNVDRRLVYDDPTDNTHINLQPGIQTLNGEKALGYVRHRHDNRGTQYYSSDFDRNKRQQEVIKSILNKMLTIEGIAKLPDVIKTAGEHVNSDFSKQQILGLANDFKNYSNADFIVLETEAYWNSSTFYTMLPTDKRDEIRTALQTAMKMDSSEIAAIDLNDSPFDGSAEYVNNSKPKKKSTTNEKTVSPKKETERESASESKENSEQNSQPPVTETNPGTDNSGGNTQPGHDPNQPPADVIGAPNFQENQPVSEQNLVPIPESTPPPVSIMPPPVNNVPLQPAS